MTTHDVQGTRFTSHAATHVGRTRTGNEDNFYAGSTVFAVADGMGGHAAGEVASETALQPLESVDGREFASGAQALHVLSEAVRAANHDVVAKAAADTSLRGMGTTLTAVLLRGGRLHLAHVGDSRAYLFRPGTTPSQLTTDHTLVEQLVQEGRLSRDEIATHPQRSVITRAIGVETTVDVDTLGPIELLGGDQVLLCSDGLSGVVGDDQMVQLLSASEDGDAAVTALVEAANDNGGPDNITVVLLRVLKRDSPPPGLAGEVDEDTAELAPGGGRAEGPVRRIRTGESSSAGFDAGALGRLGSTQGVEGPSGEADSVARRWRRVIGGVVGALVLVAVVGFGGYLVLSRSHYVGVDGDVVAIFTGVPQQVGGIALSRLHSSTDLPVSEFPEVRQRALRAGIIANSLPEAEARVEDLRAEVTPDSAPTQGPPAPSEPAPAPAEPTAPDPAAPAPAPAPGPETPPPAPPAPG